MYRKHVVFIALELDDFPTDSEQERFSKFAVASQYPIVETAPQRRVIVWL